MPSKEQREQAFPTFVHVCSSPSPAVCGHTQVGVVSAFAQTLRRYTSLNHLAQAARAVLQNTSQINQMLSDLNRVDFANVQVTFPNKVPHSWEQVSGTSLESRGNVRVTPTLLPSLPPSKKIHRSTNSRS